MDNLMSSKKIDKNLDQKVIDSFGEEWSNFSYQTERTDSALDSLFAAYSKIVDFSEFNAVEHVAADFGAGSGRWTSRLLPFFSKTYALEPSVKAFEVLCQKFDLDEKVVLLNESVGSNCIPNNSLDFAMSLGVLHHVPDTKIGIAEICEKVRPGGTFHCYLYYKLENKPLHYRLAFKVSSILRILISRLPFATKKIVCKTIAILIYLPLSRLSILARKIGLNESNIPLYYYSDQPLLMMQNDALDRFGTRLEQRFSRQDIQNMLSDTGFDLSTLKFSDSEPFWTFTIRKKLSY